MQNEQIDPFLKWPGGKRWLVKSKDFNEELINLYMVIQEKPDELKEQMCFYQEKHSRT